MSFRYYNPNPRHRNHVGDCTVRAVSKVLGVSWESAYIDLVIQGYLLGDMPSSNSVMDSYLRSQGFTKDVIRDRCPDDCYTVKDFVKDHPHGTYLLGTGTHAIAVDQGSYFDSWDSGDEPIIYFYHKESIQW